MSVKSVTGITDVQYAACKGGLWGTEALLGVGHGVYGISDGFTKKKPNMPNEATGQAWETETDLGNTDAPWTHTAELTYDGMMLLLAMIFGTGPAPAQQGLTTAYKHQIQLTDDLLGLYFTYAKNYKAALFVAPSVKLTSVKFSGPNKNGRIDVVFTGVAFDKLSGSGTNTLTTFQNVTWPYVGNRVLFRQGAFRMNVQGAAALGAGDLLKVGSFYLEIQRPQKGEYTSEFGDRQDEPTKDGRPSVSLVLNYPRFNDDGKARIDSFDAGTLFKMDMTYTGALIASTYYRQMVFRLPQLVMERPGQSYNANTIPQKATFRAQKAQSAPLGMQLADIGYDLTQPLDLQAVNTQSTGALA